MLRRGQAWHLHTDSIIQRLQESPELRCSKDSGAWKNDYFHTPNCAQFSGLSHLAAATQHNQGETLESQKGFTWSLSKM